MKSILQELFNGNVYPSENIMPKDPRVKIIHQEIGKLKECLDKSLRGEDLGNYAKLMDLITEAEIIYDYECFSHGFRLAVTLMAEGIRNPDDLHGYEQ